MLTWHFIHFEKKKAWEMALDLGGEIWGANQQKGSSAEVMSANLFFFNVFACGFINEQFSVLLKKI